MGAPEPGLALRNPPGERAGAPTHSPLPPGLELAPALPRRSGRSRPEGWGTGYQGPLHQGSSAPGGQGREPLHPTPGPGVSAVTPPQDPCLPSRVRVTLRAGDSERRGATWRAGVRVPSTSNKQRTRSFLRAPSAVTAMAAAPRAGRSHWMRPPRSRRAEAGRGGAGSPPGGAARRGRGQGGPDGGGVWARRKEAGALWRGRGTASRRPEAGPEPARRNGSAATAAEGPGRAEQGPAGQVVLPSPLPRFPGQSLCPTRLEL